MKQIETSTHPPAYNATLVEAVVQLDNRISFVFDSERSTLAISVRPDTRCLHGQMHGCKQDFACAG